MSKNAPTVDQIKIACRHVTELLTAGVTANTAIRTLERMADVYCKFRVKGYVSPHHADEYELWSKAAREAKAANPKKQYGQYLRVEHGTPKRAFAHELLAAFNAGILTKEWIDEFCDRKWKVAVITHEEDKRLQRSKAYATPEERWAAAKIVFE